MSKGDDSLNFTLFVAAAKASLATVAAQRACRVKRSETFRVGLVGLATPECSALAFHGGTHAVEAVAFASVAGHRVLDVEVLGAFPGEPGAQLSQVALVGGLPARRAGRLQFAVITAGAIRAVGFSL